MDIVNTKAAWIFYLLGAFLTLGWKLIRYLRHQKSLGIPTSEAFKNWIFEDSVENTVSWVTTIALVWVGGAVFIDLRSESGIFSFIQAVPMHNAIAFAFGGIMELAAPEAAKNFVKWLVSKFPGGQP